MPLDVPIEKVIALRSHDMTNEQIMQALQSDGYDIAHVSEAMQQADIKEEVSKTNLERGGPMPMPEMQPGAMPPAAAPMPQQAAMQQAPQASMDEQIQEVAEQIIDEKWDELTENIKLIVDWKNQVEQRISQIESNFNSLKDNFDKLHTAVIDKVSEYDTNIRSVGTNIKALEHVFQKILPGFVDNVNELSRIADKIKKTVVVEGKKKKA